MLAIGTTMANIYTNTHTKQQTYTHTHTQTHANKHIYYMLNRLINSSFLGTIFS